MDEILLYLTLKYSGQWLSIYDSLKAREKISKEDFDNVRKQINCQYTSLLDNEYPNGWKDIYKPPFGIFTYGKYELINSKPIITIFGQPSEENKPFLDFIVQNGGKLLWPNLSNREMIEVLKNFKRDNLFWLSEIKNQNNRTYQHILEDVDVTTQNLFYSELWTKNNEADYTQQMPERLYLGLGKYALVLDKLDSKQLLALASYASMEDIKIVFKKELFEDRMRKIFSKCKVWLVDDKDELLDYFFED